MRAALLRAYGGTVELGERPRPEPEPDETLVRVSAAPIVPLDLLCASGTSYFGQQPLPYVPGVQGVGVVEQLARPARRSAGVVRDLGRDGARRRQPGRVVHRTAADLVPITADVTDAAAAAIGTSGIAAWMALRWRARLQRRRARGRARRERSRGPGGARRRPASGAGRVVAVCRSEAAAQRAIGHRR